MPESRSLISEAPSTDSYEKPSDVLNPAQLRLIEAVHRGFLYQHLYAVGCLLRLANVGGLSVSVERDEDIEIALEGSSLYLQIKTRTEALNRGDIKGALQRFEEIRSTHKSDLRSGTPQFQIIANVPPNASLMADLSTPVWPADVKIRWPDSPACVGDDWLPPAWPDLPAAIAWCFEAARTVPFAAVSPETLVWKLAARIHFAATGNDQERPSHSFNKADLPALFEQIVEQLQDFPSVPENYRPQANEPNLDSPTRIRFITGLSGAGKTAWAAQVARHCASLTAYFDVADLPGPAVASSLARELVARFLGGRGGVVGEVLLPSASGFEMLRALDRRIEVSPTPIVVIDNAHRISGRDLFDITEACTRVRFVFLNQPWPGLAEIEALFNKRAESLAGWDTDSIAAEFSEAGCRIDPATAERWRVMTGGMPLFVRNAARLAFDLYMGNAVGFADDIQKDAHSTVTTQEVILTRLLDTLSPDARMALAALSLSIAPLTREEADAVLAALEAPSRPWGRSLRELTTCGGLQLFADGRLKVHDALRILGRALQSNLPSGALLKSQKKLRDLLSISLQKHLDIIRFGIWLRLLPATGDFETLVNVATFEYFHEFGDPTDLKSVLEAAVESDELDEQGRFWTLDALAFWDWHAGIRGETFSARLDQMASLITKGRLGDREQQALIMKQMTSAAIKGNADDVEVAFEQAQELCNNDPLLMRIVRYNHANALFELGRYSDVEREAKTLYLEYYSVLGLDWSDVVGVNPPQIIKALGGKLDANHQDDLKHLADCLDLYAMSRRKRGLYSGLANLHALKFYVMSGAYRSAVRTGQEAVDDFLTIQRDPEFAREFMECHLLPLVREYGLTANMVPVCAQYAIILAYCGESKLAREEIKRLQPFASSLNPHAQHELQNQMELVDAINHGLIEIPRPASGESIPERHAPRKITKVGRNDPCPCGSGKKYKKCCLG
ncbi:SEC-C metal-binding domain-containing protein [Desulforhabdus sp. TSK]|uniref:SEC-C metal-binding domain-containing protein n=1 Tax=Desulforhabdus sp. TSK TaxID=2925014 RepID=UPI001FC8D18E|nr:SEC-C metal-binding domain-containing protein [Desulforhabdus sp. TSK]GKT10540.1 hypothetical protein DSTSK_38450 [Desulforhabdus sp. TSK]